jgi:hypothetical protein
MGIRMAKAQVQRQYNRVEFDWRGNGFDLVVHVTLDKHDEEVHTIVRVAHLPPIAKPIQRLLVHMGMKVKRLIRQQRKLTVKEFAQEAGLDLSQQYFLENLHYRPALSGVHAMYKLVLTDLH